MDKLGSGTSLVKSNILGIDCGLDCNEPYAANTPVKLSAQPAPGYQFVHWSGACTGTTCALTMNAAKKVTAHFALQSFALTVANKNKTGGTVSGGGINCGPTCTRNFPYATIVTLRAVPKQGYLFAGWGGHCAAVTGRTCRVEVSQARNVSANFTPAP